MPNNSEVLKDQLRIVTRSSLVECLLSFISTLFVIFNYISTKNGILINDLIFEMIFLILITLADFFVNLSSCQKYRDLAAKYLLY